MMGSVRLRISVWVPAMFIAAVARAATLDATTNLSLYPPIPLQSGGQNVATNGSGVYDFGDKDGNGTRDDAVTPAGLDFGSNGLHTTNKPSGSIALRLNGGDITNGNSAVTNLSTSIYEWGGANCGGIVIRHAGQVTLGTVDTRMENGNNNNKLAGSVQIGEPTGTGDGPAGGVRIANIWAYGTPYGGGGSVTIYGTGNVTIAASSGTNGNIYTYGGATVGGAVSVQHHGAFVAAKVRTSAVVAGLWSGDPDSGSATFNGNCDGAGVIGGFRVDGIDTSVGGGGGNGSGGAISIYGYTNVVVGTNGLVTYVTIGGSVGNAGDISITNITGDIRIDGPINAAVGGTGTKGAVNLAAGGSVTVSNLDLSKVSYAAFDANGGSYITGLLTGTNGAAATGLDNIGTALRTPAGKEIRYWKKANLALGGQALTLANESGTPGAGGRLRPWPSAGTVVMFK